MFNVYQHGETYILIQKSKESKTFKSNFIQFFSLLPTIAKEVLLSGMISKLTALLERQGFPLIFLLVGLSSSTFRPFRHTATTAGFALISGLAKLLQSINQEWVTLSEQNKVMSTI